MLPVKCHINDKMVFIVWPDAQDLYNFFPPSFFNEYFVVSYCHILHVPSLMFNPKKANSFLITSGSDSRMYKHLVW